MVLFFLFFHLPWLRFFLFSRSQLHARQRMLDLAPVNKSVRLDDDVVNKEVD